MEKKIITKELEQYYLSKGLIRIQNHSYLDLTIANYTEKVVYENLWDENLLKYRGLIYNSKYEIISRGFDRFFNIEENRHEPTNDFKVFEKLDGQYIGVFWYNGEMVVNSKGSFTSPYAIEAKKILEEKYPEFIKFWTKTPVKDAYSFCFELIGVEQIVVSYPEPDLVLTGCFRHICYEPIYNFWEDIDINQNNEHFIHSTKLKFVKHFSGLDYKSIKQLNWQNAEGFVVRFSNGQRCKIKFEDYLNLHRQMTNLSTTGIWEALMEGKPISSILNDVPDEFYSKVHEYETDLKNQFSNIEKVCLEAVKNLKSWELNRKQFASLSKLTKYPSILFAMLDGKDYSKIIWKLIKPKFEKI